MSDMSRNVVAEWVRSQRLASPVTKLILQLTFDHAGPQEDGRWVAWVGNKTLAWEACFKEGPNAARTVRKHLADLEAAGVIEREERSRGNGSQTTNRVVLLIPEGWTAPGGRAEQTGGVGPHSPPQKPQVEAPTGSPKQEKAAGDARDKIPDDFPDALRPHAREVMRILRAVAEQQGARKVWPQKVALVVMAHPRHALVAQAHKLAAWAVDAKRPIKDVVSTYQGFLDRDGELAAVERLADDGTPSAGQTAAATNVHPIRASNRNGKPTHSELISELRATNPRLQAQHAALTERT